MSQVSSEGLRAQSLENTINQTGIEPDIRSLWDSHHEFLYNAGIYEKWRLNPFDFGSYSHILQRPDLFSTQEGNQFARDVINTARKSNYDGADDLIAGIQALRKAVLHNLGTRPETSFGVPWYYSLEMLFGDKHIVDLDINHFNERDKSWWGRNEGVEKIRDDLKSRFYDYFRSNPYYSAREHDSYDKEDEVEKMAEIACDPTGDERQLKYRQAVLEELAHSEKLDQLLTAKETARAIAYDAATHLLTIAYRSGFDQNGTPILYYYKTGKDTVVDYPEDEYMADDDDKEDDIKGTEINIVDELTKGCELITTSSKAMVDCATFLRTLTNPLFHVEADVLEGLVKESQELMSKDAILHRPTESELKKEWEEGGRSLIDQEVRIRDFFWKGLTPALHRVGALVEIARFIRDGQFSKVGHDNSQPDYYEKGWNVSTNSEAQVRNGSLGEVAIAILSGANTSGKSFYLESDLVIRLIAQSIGHAPVKAGNIHMHNGYVYINRSGTQTDQNLSAYTKEVADLNGIIEGIKSGTRVYIDEGFSTTSPDEQGQLLSAVALDIGDNGGSCVLATHNRRVIDYLHSYGAEVYHLAVSVDPDEKALIRHFLLTPGTDESYAIVAARTGGLQEDIIEGVLTYLEGSAFLNAPRTIEHPAPTTFTLAERESLKKQIKSIEHLFPDSPISPRFMLFSEDTDFTTNGFLRFLSNSDLFNEITDDFKRAIYRELIAKMVLFSQTLSPQETLERQKMFEGLLDEGLFEKIAKNVIELNGYETQMRMIASANGKSGINRALNPFHVDPERRKERDPDNEFIIEKKQLDLAIAFLQVNSILLGEKFSHGKLLRKLVKVQAKIDTAGGLSAVVDKILRKAAPLVEQLEVINDSLPRVDISQVDVDTIRHQLEVLSKEKEIELDENEEVKETDKRNRSDLLLKEIDIILGGLPRALLEREKHIEQVHRLVSTLQTADSIYLNQSALYIEGLFTDLMQGQIPAKKTVENLRISYRPSLSFLGGKHDKRDDFFDLFGFDFKDKGLLAEELDRINALASFADIIATEKLTRCEFTPNDEVAMDDIQPIFVKDREERRQNSLLMNSTIRTELLTGPHASGKTVYEKSAVAAVLFALSTGYTTSTTARLPLFDSVVYLDRVVKKHNRDKSSFATELDYWIELIDSVNSGRSAFVAIDEAFSTTAPKEGGAFVFSVLKKLYESGSFVLTSNHNHDLINQLINMSNRSIPPYHFSSIGADGSVSLDHVKKPGHENSYAIAIARQQGFPERILTRAEEFARD